jgi:uncharacterized repeat protein (TIGR02543 family)
MFYHDHSFGITRLNVYAGEAAGYLIRDDIEQNLIDNSIIPGTRTNGTTAMGGEIPLVIEDKTFVNATNIDTLDPTWVWGTGPRLMTWVDSTGAAIPACNGQTTCNSDPNARKKLVVTPKSGDLWWPHVYLPAENPSALGGVNPVGRWVYGLYFWPPTTGIKFLPVANPYYDCGHDGLCDSPWEPPTMPATPNPSWTAEAFLDTQTVNGTVFPKLDLEPKAYRLRILNASHDRFVNLQLYVADSSVNGNIDNPLYCTQAKPCALNTEVKMVPAVEYPGYPDWTPAADSRVGGVPDPTTAGPDWIQIGNEGGFLPQPAIIKNKPISFVLDPTLFNVGNVNDGTLMMGPAERADVIIDFSAYAGKTLILYNDAPAAFPAFVPNNDYYTGSPDLQDVGGYSGTLAGTGPNTRTIMQINVANTTAAPFGTTEMNSLVNAFTSTQNKPSVFQQSQHPVIVGQSAYDSAYNTTFPSTLPNWGLSAIGDNALSFETIVNPLTSSKELAINYPMLPKALHDEMGAVWDEYGRMSAKLGVEIPGTNNLNQIFVMQNYQDPPTELVQDGKVQLWKITHNGVDTHPLHFHLFDVQVINRVGWDGFIRLPWENELGWKETVRISPLEDTIVALRPRSPILPFKLDDSVRLYQPALPEGSVEGFMNLDPLTGQAMPTSNISYNYGAEYVWHCHILSHEEQDMMRPMVFRVATAVSGIPTGLSFTQTMQANTLTWNDTTYNVTYDRTTDLPPYNYNTTLGFIIERCPGDATACNAGSGIFTEIGRITMVSSATPSFVDASIANGQAYTYRVKGYNTWVDNTVTPPKWWIGPTDSAATTIAFYGSVGAVVAPTPASAVSLNPYFPSPHVAPVKFFAQGSGSSGSYQYRFWLDGSIVQDYSTTRYWIIPTGTPPGIHNIKVDVRTNFSSTSADKSANMDYTISPLTYTVNFVPGANGSISPTGSQTVNGGGATTTVTATANPNFNFVNWTDALNNVVGITPALILTNVQSNMTVTANFDPFTVTFASSGNGTLNGSNNQTVNYGGTTSAITAMPAPNYHFVNWTGSGGFTSTTNPLVLTNVSANQSITANFAIDTFTVNFTSSGNGTLSGSPSQTINYNGSTIAVVPVPATGYHFVNWTGTGGFITSTMNPLVVTNVTANQIITANFALDTFAVNFVNGANGTLSGTTNQVVSYGSSTTAVAAVPAPNYHFVNWTGTGGFTPSTSNPLTVSNVTADQTITANFAIDAFTVNFVNIGNGTLTGNTNQIVNYGASTTVMTAVPATGFFVFNWTDGFGNILATNSNTFTLNNVTANQTITANFAPLTALVKIGATNYATLQAAYNAASTGQTIEISAGPNTGTLLANRPVDIFISGGWNSGFTVNTGMTTIHSITTINNGSVKVSGVSVTQ